MEETMNKSGQHETIVHEKVAPAVTKETIIKTLHEESIPTIEKEIHQAHYHTSIQPIQDRDERPAQHEHRVEEVQRKEFRHGDDDAVRELLAQEAAQFQDSREEGETQYTHEEAQPVVNEHIHHHFYEVIQPVIQKEVIIPTVVHKTIPIHEVHRNEAKHHAATALPPMSMADFRKQGGTLNGREERYDRFEGKPQIGASERDDESILSDTSKDSYTTSQDRRSPIDEGNRRGQKPLEQPTPLRKSKPAKNNPGWRSPPSSMARMEESPRASRDNASTSKPPKSSRRSPDRKSPVSSGDRFGTDSQFRKVESTLPDKLRTSQSAANRRSTVAGKERKKARDRSPGDDRKFSLG